MLLGHDIAAGLIAAAELVNAHPETEPLRRLGTTLGEIWTADEAGAVRLINELLRDSPPAPQLVRHDGWDYHLHPAGLSEPLIERRSVESAWALAELVRTKELGRLRSCAADGCGRVLVDLSRNRSRRFCSPACTSRTNVAAFRARRPRASVR